MLKISNTSSQATAPTKTVTALIADDEAWLRQSLQEQLQQLWPELTIIAECENGEEALEKTLLLQPDILLLDINMPYLSGIDIAQKLAHPELIEQLSRHHKPLPLLVFITAYDEFAIEAFTRNAVDYVLKPVQTARLLTTIERLQQRLALQTQAASSQAYHQQLQSLHDSLSQQSNYLQQVTVTVGQRRILLDMDEVLCIQADGKYSKFVTLTHEYLLRESLNELEKQLDPQIFWRIHRSSLLNIQHMDYCTPTVTGRLEVSLKDHPLKLTVSRQHIAKFKGL